MGKIGRTGVIFCLVLVLAGLGAPVLPAGEAVQQQSRSDSLFSFNPFVFFRNLLGRATSNAVDASVPAGGFSPAPTTGSPPPVPGDYHNFLPDYVPGESIYEGMDAEESRSTPQDGEPDTEEPPQTDTSGQQDPNGDTSPSSGDEAPSGDTTMPIDESDEFQIDPDQLKDYNVQPESNPWADGSITVGSAGTEEPLDYESHLPYDEMIWDPQTGRVSYRVDGKYMTAEEYELKALGRGKTELDKKSLSKAYEIMAVGNRLDREKKELQRQIRNSQRAGLGHPRGQQARVDKLQEELDALEEAHEQMMTNTERYENRIKELRHLLGLDKPAPEPASGGRSQSMAPDDDPFAEADAINNQQFSRSSLRQLDTRSIHVGGGETTQMQEHPSEYHSE